MPIWAIKLGGGLLLVAALIAGYLAWANHQQSIGEARATAAYNESIADQKREAAAVLKNETAKAVATERALQDFKNQQEVQDAQHRKTTDNLTARLRALTGSAGRLRDPHAGRGPGGGSAPGAAAAGPGNSPDHGAETGRVLSAELTGLLQRLAIEADAINLAYISCRADAELVRAPR